MQSDCDQFTALRMANCLAEILHGHPVARNVSEGVVIHPLADASSCIAAVGFHAEEAVNQSAWAESQRRVVRNDDSLRNRNIESFGLLLTFQSWPLCR